MEKLSAAEWGQVAHAFADYGHRQGPEYCRLAAARSGASAEAVVCVEDGHIVGAANVRVRRVPLLGGGIAYVSGGPMVRLKNGEKAGLNAAAALRSTLSALVAEYVRRRGLVLRVAPAMGDRDWDDAQGRAFSDAGFLPARGPRYRTLIVDLSPDPAPLRAGLQQKWRNCLNSAERQGLTVRDCAGPAGMDEFTSLYSEFQGRKGFHAEFDAEFYAGVQRGADENERLVVQLAEKDGRPVAGHVSVMGGDTCTYLLGATSQEGLKCKAAYLLQWRTMLLARDRGLRSYDLGGIDPEGNSGVYHFKRGMGGTERIAAGPFELRPRNLRALMALSSESLYRKLRQARARVHKA